MEDSAMAIAEQKQRELEEDGKAQDQAEERKLQSVLEEERMLQEGAAADQQTAASAMRAEWKKEEED